jgi:hypothetical protein
MSAELGGWLNEAICAYFKKLYQHLPGVTEENREKRHSVYLVCGTRH